MGFVGLLIFKERTDFFFVRSVKNTNFHYDMHFVFNLYCVSICVVLGYSHRVDLFVPI